MMTTKEETSHNWVKPNDLMKSRKMRAKKQALRARLSSSPIQNKLIKQIKNKQLSSPSSYKNPFKCLNDKKEIEDNVKLSEISDENSLFGLAISLNKSNSSRDNGYNFPNFLTEAKTDFKKVENKTFSEEILPVDWSLKSKVRFTSFKPLQWRHTFKTSEEATGTTGFVRCLNAETQMKDGRTLDTSSNAQFYQCCLVWQHPSLPFITLFPREKQKASGQFGIYASDKKICSALHSEWGESLRSLYQLLRVRQCPFFYICAHSFTCLFRAAGIAGFQHTHAFITPTTRGFREAMKKEGVEFSMPLIEKDYSELKQGNLEDIDDFASEANDEAEEPDQFLETLGLETSQFPTLNQSRGKIENKKIQSVDGSAQSLVYVEDMELQGLINFLLNCGSCILTTGPMAGIPPTLLSPVSFNGGTLRSLKVNGSTVRTTNGETQYCVDIQGPLLPTAVLHLCSLLSSSQDSYAVNLVPLNSSLPFCTVLPSLIGSSMPLAFASEGLVDCGIGEDVREVLCKSNDNFHENFPSSYRHINFNTGKYSWSDKL